MAEKSKTREITLVDKQGTFSVIRNRFIAPEEEFDFEALSVLRKLLSNEKARLLHTVKTKKPKSLYKLAQILKRDFKSVSEDVKILERFGFIEMVSEHTGKRSRKRPVLAIDTLHVNIKI